MGRGEKRAFVVVATLPARRSHRAKHRVASAQKFVVQVAAKEATLLQPPETVPIFQSARPSEKRERERGRRETNERDGRRERVGEMEVAKGGGGDDQFPPLSVHSYLRL